MRLDRARSQTLAQTLCKIFSPGAFENTFNWLISLLFTVCLFVFIPREPTVTYTVDANSSFCVVLNSHELCEVCLQPTALTLNAMGNGLQRERLCGGELEMQPS